MANVQPVPQGMHTVTPQLALEGAAEAIVFFKKAFGAEETHRALDPSGKKIWHAELKIGSSTIFVNDVAPEMGGKPFPAQLWLYVDNCDASFKRAVDAGAKALMPVMDMFWGDRFGKVSDRWGNEWGIATHVKDLTPEETKKAEQEFIAQMSKGQKK